jgi:hypothetical protein
MVKNPQKIHSQGSQGAFLAFSLGSQFPGSTLIDLTALRQNMDLHDEFLPGKQMVI